MWLNLVGLRVRARASRRCGGSRLARTPRARPRSSCSRSRWRTTRSAGGAAASARRCSPSRVVGSLALPLAARGAGRDGSPHYRRTATRDRRTRRAAAGPRVSLMLCSTARRSTSSGRSAADGRLPNFGRLLDGGASMDLATIRPTQPDPVWTAVATGMYPPKNGVRSAALYYAVGGAAADRPAARLLLLAHARPARDRPRRAASVRGAARAAVLVASSTTTGSRTGIVRWPLTRSGRTVDGFMVSDRFHQILGSMSEIEGRSRVPAGAEAVGPSGLRRRRHRGCRSALERRTCRCCRGTSPARGGIASTRGRCAMLQRDVRRTGRPRCGTRVSTSVGHYFLRDAPAVGVWRRHGRRAAAVRHRCSTATTPTSTARSARRSTALRPGRSAARRLRLRHAAGEPAQAARRAAPAGTRRVGHARPRARRLPARVRHRRRRTGAASAARSSDVAPTVLYYLGVPIGRDMDGFTRADLFSQIIHRRAADHVHSVASAVKRESRIPNP